MSAILKALKKLENQTTDGFGAAPSGSKALQKAPAYAVQIERRFKPGLFVLAVVAAGVLGAGGLWFTMKTPEKPAPKAASLQDAAPKTAKPSKPPAPPAIRPPQPPLAKPNANPPPVLSQRSLPVLDSAKPPIQQAPSKPSIPDSEPQSRVASNPPPAPEPAKQALTIPDEPPAPMPLPQQPSAELLAEESDAPPVLKNSPLKIQAIAWAEDPQRRIAVINGRIFHEGEMADEFLVQNIHPDAIEVKQGETLWTIEFKIN